jgi:hypothetical protein
VSDTPAVALVPTPALVAWLSSDWEVCAPLLLVLSLELPVLAGVAAVCVRAPRLPPEPLGPASLSDGERISNIAARAINLDVRPAIWAHSVFRPNMI